MKRILAILSGLLLAGLALAPPALAENQGQLCMATDTNFNGASVCWFPLASDSTLFINLGDYGLNNSVSSFFLGGLNGSTRCRVNMFKFANENGPNHLWPYRDWSNDVTFTNPYNGDTLHYKRSNTVLGNVDFDDGSPVGNSVSSIGVDCVAQ